MNETIEEFDVDFNDEPEPKKWLDKRTVYGCGGVLAVVDKITKTIEISKKGEQYSKYKIYCHTEYDEYILDNIFRNQLHWKKEQPKKINITVDKVGEFYNWNIKPIV